MSPECLDGQTVAIAFNTGDNDMARFAHSLAQTFLRSRARPEPSILPMLPAVETVLDDPAERLGGPGWFDSSWDLQRGLEVREGLPGDPQLNEWIEVCLRGGIASARPAPIMLPSSDTPLAILMPSSATQLPIVVPSAAMRMPSAASPSAQTPTPATLRGVAAADRPCDWALV